METQIKREMVDRQINNLLSKLLLDQVFYYLQLNTFLTYSEMLLIGNGTVLETFCSGFRVIQNKASFLSSPWTSVAHMYLLDLMAI